MRKCGLVILACLLIGANSVLGQVSNAGRSVFSFMGLPASSKLNALGGSNVSLSDGDISMAMCNPALLHATSHMTLQLNYSYYLPGTMFGSALYGHNFGRSKIEKPFTGDGEPDKPNYFAVGIHYLDYGTMKYADEYGNQTGGSFGARDILIDVMYARQLHPCWKVGVTNPYGPGAVDEWDLVDTSLSTSGNTPGYDGHIVNPATGERVSGRRMVSVRCPDPLDAEVLSTALMLATPSDEKSLASAFPDAVFRRYALKLTFA